MKAQTIDIDGYKVNHVETGFGEPVILLHGLGGSWEDWIELITLLSPFFRICAIDLPGFGMSPPPDELPVYNLAIVASFISRLMEVKGYDHAFLVGNSMGGGIALRCAIDFPEQVRGVVLANAVGLGREIAGFNRGLAFPGAARLSIPIVSKPILRAIWKTLFFNPSKISPAMIDRTWEWIRKPETKKFLIHLYPKALSISGQRDILLSDLSRIRCSILITWGINDAVLPVRQADEAYQKIHSAELLLIRDCGHVPQIEQAAIFNQVTQEFLTKLLSL
jgi:pimeloyl-ACP methyl ester carboxylesterase